MKAVRELLCEIISRLKLIGVCGGIFMIFYRICELCYCVRVYPTHTIRRGCAVMMIFMELAIWFFTVYSLGGMYARGFERRYKVATVIQCISHLAFLIALYFLYEYILFLPFYIVLSVYGAVSVAFLIYNFVMRKKSRKNAQESKKI